MAIHLAPPGHAGDPVVGGVYAISPRLDPPLDRAERPTAVVTEEGPALGAEVLAAQQLENLIQLVRSRVGIGDAELAVNLCLALTGPLSQPCVHLFDAEELQHFAVDVELRHAGKVPPRQPRRARVKGPTLHPLSPMSVACPCDDPERPVAVRDRQGRMGRSDGVLTSPDVV